MTTSVAASVTKGVDIAFLVHLPLSPFKDELSVNHEKLVLLKEFPADHHQGSGGDLSVLSSHERLCWF